MRRPRAPLILLVAASVLLLAGGLVAETVLLAAAARARMALWSDLGHGSGAAPAPDGPDPAVLEARALLRRRDAGGAASLLSAQAELLPTPESRARAARAEAAAGRFDRAARHAWFAARLLPDHPGAPPDAERATDLAVLARLRPLTRFAGLLGGLTLLALGLAALRRRHVRQRLGRWLEDVRVEVRCGVDGRHVCGPAGDTLLAIPGGTGAVVLDVLFHDAGAPPAPGPTVSVVLSNGASSRTVRLAPVHHVREDAIRFRPSPGTVAALAAAPGRWRLCVRLDGEVAAERTVEVVAVLPAGVPALA